MKIIAWCPRHQKEEKVKRLYFCRDMLMVTLKCDTWFWIPIEPKQLRGGLGAED